MAQSGRRVRLRNLVTDGLTLSVEGYKAVRNRKSLEIAPLTVIAGANSSGKSSFIQPFLLMKQTLDSAFDPGPLLLYGSNAKITDYSQIFSRGKAKYDIADAFSIGLESNGSERTVTFAAPKGELEIRSDVIERSGSTLRLSEHATATELAELRHQLAGEADTYWQLIEADRSRRTHPRWKPSVYRNRCFLEPRMIFEREDRGTLVTVSPRLEVASDNWIELLRGIIHVPGLRGNPERSYPRSAVGDMYPGTFETYVASILFEWSQLNPDRLTAVAHDLEMLGLTWKVVARRVNDASIEVLVGRMTHAQQGGAFDLVSIADVGFGVSQTLPVVVALHSARPGQIVYVEQPEIHLHPRAQVALAILLIAAAKRGVLVIAETHSSLLIRGIQTQIARGSIDPHSVSFNWFSRDEVSGTQEILRAHLDKQGRFGDWPIDFDDVGRAADWDYLDAVTAHQGER